MALLRGLPKRIAGYVLVADVVEHRVPLSGSMVVLYDSSYLIAAYLRIASLAIALYDYLETAPRAYKFYREHWEHRHFSISVLLFVAIRTISISTLVISSVGFFYDEFTLQTCSQFYLWPPAFKVLQAMVSQAILGVRTFNLSRRSKRVGWLILTVYVAATTLQWVTTMHQRRHQHALTVNHACRAFSVNRQLGAWIFYAISMMFDVVVTALSVFYLLKFKLVMKNTMMAKVTKMMMYDGLGYLLVLTCVNILNLLLFKTSAEIQTAGSSLAYCLSWIMSQRLLMHLYDASRERQEGTVSQIIGSTRDVSRVIRSHWDQKNGFPFDRSRPTFEVQSSNQHVVLPEDVGVQVRVERTVQRNHYMRTYELEDYSRRSHNHTTSQVHVGSN